MPAADAGGEDVGEVVVVGEGLEAEGRFEGGSHVGAVLVEEDVVDDVDEELGALDAGLGTVLPDGFVVVPVVPDGFGDARGGYRTCGTLVLGSEGAISSGHEQYQSRHQGTRPEGRQRRHLHMILRRRCRVRLVH